MANHPNIIRFSSGNLRTWLLPHPHTAAVLPAFVVQNLDGVDALLVELEPQTEIWMPNTGDVAALESDEATITAGEHKGKRVAVYLPSVQPDGTPRWYAGDSAAACVNELGEPRQLLDIDKPAAREHETAGPQASADATPRERSRLESMLAQVRDKGRNDEFTAAVLGGILASSIGSRVGMPERTADVQVTHPLKLGAVRMFFAFAFDEAKNVEEVERMRFVLGRELAAMADAARDQHTTGTLASETVLPQPAQPEPSAGAEPAQPALEPDETNGARAAERL